MAREESSGQYCHHAVMSFRVESITPHIPKCNPVLILGAMEEAENELVPDRDERAELPPAHRIPSTTSYGEGRLSIDETERDKGAITGKQWSLEIS